MAILLEPEKKSVSWFSIVLVALILLFLGALVYYLFFVSPPLIGVIVPASLEPIKNLPGANIDVSQIVNDPNFKSLRPYPSVSPSGNIGRSNPFAPL